MIICGIVHTHIVQKSKFIDIQIMDDHYTAYAEIFTV